MNHLGWCVVAATSALALSGCCHTPVIPPCPECPPLAACIKTPPPVLKPVKFADGCPADMTLCLDNPNALNLESNVRAMKLWQQEQWARCGPVPNNK